jgi:hypothetical protein
MMKMKITSLLILTCFGISALNAQKEQSAIPGGQRFEKIIDSNWTFNYYPGENAGKGYETPGMDDSRWQAVSLPHTWSTYETTGELHPFIRNASQNDDPFRRTGWGWYRKHFSIKNDYSDRKVFIEFEGVQKYCKIWINGKYLGDHKGGWGSFDFDITQFVKSGADNVVAVAVNNRPDDNFKVPHTDIGNSDIYGGIRGDVIIVLKNNLYIPMQGSSSHEGGTFITTPAVSQSEGIVRVQTWIKNDNSQNRNCILQTTIADSAGKTIEVLKSDASIAPGQLYRFDQTGNPIKKPHLWSHENPYLYHVQSEVIDGKAVVDACTASFGFRWFRWNFDENCFYVNGKKMVIHGGKRNQSYPWLGNAIPKWITVKYYLDLSENLNYNFMCTGPDPDEKLVYELADKYGTVIDEESPGIQNQDSSVEAQEQQLKEMIRRDRNHPSIMVWSIGNETDHTVRSKIMLSEDTTRILSAGNDTNFHCGTYKDIITEKGRMETVATGQEQSGGTRLAMSGEPSRITLKSSHNKMTADRGSVVILTADIIDSLGNHVIGASNTIKWKVTGPAILVGPSVYESDINRQGEQESALYMDMPVSNLIRSTGKPGKIKVTVLASGLASASAGIEAEEIQPDNSVIMEPVLTDDGRRPVTRTTLYVNKLDDVPQEIKMTFEDFRFEASDRKGFAAVIKDFIFKNNSLVDTGTVEFKVLTDLLASQLVNNNGQMVADDYNFNVEHYNNCRLISGYIKSTKLPQLFQEGLKNYYTDAIIRHGSEKNAGEEMNWLNWIPSGGTVIISQDGPVTAVKKGAIVTGKQELGDLIAVVYPAFRNFSAEGRERALKFISKMNPFIRVSSVSLKSGEGDKGNETEITYTAEKEKPILIPLLKFIAE